MGTFSGSIMSETANNLTDWSRKLKDEYTKLQEELKKVYLAHEKVNNMNGKGCIKLNEGGTGKHAEYEIQITPYTEADTLDIKLDMSALEKVQGYIDQINSSMSISNAAISDLETALGNIGDVASATAATGATATIGAITGSNTGINREITPCSGEAPQIRPKGDTSPSTGNYDGKSVLHPNGRNNDNSNNYGGGNYGGGSSGAGSSGGGSFGGGSSGGSSSGSGSAEDYEDDYGDFDNSMGSSSGMESGNSGGSSGGGGASSSDSYGSNYTPVDYEKYDASKYKTSVNNSEKSKSIIPTTVGSGIAKTTDSFKSAITDSDYTPTSYKSTDYTKSLKDYDDNKYHATKTNYSPTSSGNSYGYGYGYSNNDTDVAKTIENVTSEALPNILESPTTEYASIPNTGIDHNIISKYQSKKNGTATLAATIFGVGAAGGIIGKKIKDKKDEENEEDTALDSEENE